MKFTLSYECAVPVVVAVGGPPVALFVKVIWAGAEFSHGEKANMPVIASVKRTRVMRMVGLSKSTGFHEERKELFTLL